MEKFLGLYAFSAVKKYFFMFLIHNLDITLDLQPPFVL
jgi:hypothetical protein